jgi:hypothetical protein
MSLARGLQSCICLLAVIQGVQRTMTSQYKPLRVELELDDKGNLRQEGRLDSTLTQATSTYQNR